MRDSVRTKDTILKAAERLVGAKGIHALVLEEVAAGASVSKGGLLHHYPSKQALIRGLAERMIAEYDREIEDFRQRDPAMPGAYTRAMLRANLSCPDECAQVCAAIWTELRDFPELLDLFRQHSIACQERLEADGLDLVVASTVRYAAEGLMAAATWGMPQPGNLDQVVEYLLKLAGQPRADGSD